VYDIDFHLVWCPRYGRPIFGEAEVGGFLEGQISTIAGTRECEVLALEVMPVNIQLFVSAPPVESPAGIVKVLKGVTALRLF